MRIKKIMEQYRRDFRAIWECEHCGYEEERRGYDDSYFHQNVVPATKCAKCSKVAGPDFEPLKPKYPGDLQL